MDKVIDLEISRKLLLYRIQRGPSIVYVEIIPPSVISEDKQTYGPDVLHELAKHEPWNLKWTTLKIDGRGEKLKYTLDGSKPHQLDVEDIHHQYAHVNVQLLQYTDKLKQRVWEVTFLKRQMILKIARFEHEVEWMTNEARVYHMLQNTSLTARLVAFVYEDTCDRIVGVLLEKLEGKFPNSDDLAVCLNKMTELHKYVRHGDANRYNVIMTQDGPRFLDFEDSVVRPVVDDGSFDDSLEEERRYLQRMLSDESCLGRPMLG